MWFWFFLGCFIGCILGFAIGVFEVAQESI